MAQHQPHPIQLKKIRVERLSIEVDVTVVLTESPPEFTLETQRTDFDPEKKSIGIKVAAIIGEDVDGRRQPLRLHVIIVGEFEVNTEKFDVANLPHWAEHNGPLVMLPFLREHVSGLTVRAGVPQILLPLFQVPSFQNRPPAVAAQPIAGTE